MKETIKTTVTRSKFNMYADRYKGRIKKLSPGQLISLAAIVLMVVTIPLAVFLALNPKGPLKTRATPVTPPVTPPGPTTSYRVFISSLFHNGNFGGLEGADNWCQNQAHNAGLGGVWKAWLSSDTVAVRDRLYHGDSPYVLVNGESIANNWNDLVDGALDRPFNITEEGQINNSTWVWTNSFADGTIRQSSGSSCINWTSNDDGGATGDSSRTDSGWSNYGASACRYIRSLYCIEQPESPLPTPTPTPIISSRVFVTSSKYSGSLGGHEGADAKCQQSADNAELGGSWKAWLTTYTSDVNSRFYHSQNEYVLVNGTLIANNWGDLTDQVLVNPINVNEFGQIVDTPSNYWNVWTNTWTSGTIYDTSSQLTCNHFTSESPSLTGRGGSSNSKDFRWTASERVGHSCDSLESLYCFEQMVPPTPTPTAPPTLTPTPIPTQTPSCQYCFKGVCDGKCLNKDNQLRCPDCPGYVGDTADQRTTVVQTEAEPVGFFELLLLRVGEFFTGLFGI